MYVPTYPARATSTGVVTSKERVADLVHQDRERFLISPPGLFDQVSVHLGLRCRSQMLRSTSYDGRCWRKRSDDRAAHPDRPRASTGHQPTTVPERVAMNVSRRSITGQTWFGMTATISPTSGRAAPGGTRTIPW